MKNLRNLHVCSIIIKYARVVPYVCRQFIRVKSLEKLYYWYLWWTTPPWQGQIFIYTLLCEFSFFLFIVLLFFFHNRLISIVIIIVYCGDYTGQRYRQYKYNCLWFFLWFLRRCLLLFTDDGFFCRFSRSIHAKYTWAMYKSMTGDYCYAMSTVCD